MNLEHAREEITVEDTNIDIDTKTIVDIDPSLSYGKPLAEDNASRFVALMFNGEREVKTKSGGRIDVLTDTHIIEVKHITKWREAKGQLEDYALDYPDKSPLLYLFGSPARKRPIDRARIKQIMSKSSIEVIFDDEDHDKLIERYSMKHGAFADSPEEALHRTTVACSNVDSLWEESKQVELAMLQTESLLRRTKEIHKLAINCHLDGNIRIELMTMCSDIAKQLHKYDERIEELHTMSHIAEAYIKNCIIIDKNATTPIGDYNKSLKEWCDERKIKTYTEYKPAISKILISMGCVFVERSPRKWIGLKLTSSAPSLVV